MVGGTDLASRGASLRVTGWNLTVPRSVDHCSSALALSPLACLGDPSHIQRATFRRTFFNEEEIGKQSWNNLLLPVF
jgi:hypothetical protein